MNTADAALETAITAIKSTQGRLAVAIGIAMGIILMVYFLTFSMLVNHLNSGLLWFQGLSAILMIVAFFYLHRLSFQLALLRHRRSFGGQPWYVQLTSRHATQTVPQVVRELRR
ncbi:MAG: hypothetical protein HY940_09280 [Gammaproteobacteria bacterium]|nr:hypothetical protein [Gammaproteobacteria bacterium]